jgi:hypothetical protein
VATRHRALFNYRALRLLRSQRTMRVIGSKYSIAAPRAMLAVHSMNSRIEGFPFSIVATVYLGPKERPESSRGHNSGA